MRREHTQREGRGAAERTGLPPSENAIREKKRIEEDHVRTDGVKCTACVAGGVGRRPTFCQARRNTTQQWRTPMNGMGMPSAWHPPWSVEDRGGVR